NRNGPFCSPLSDHIFIEFTDDLTRRQLVEVRGFVDRLRYIHTHFDSTSQFLDRDVIVRVDADLACDLHRFLDDLSSAQVRIFLAPCLMTVSPSVTWPSLPIATLPLRRTQRIVVAWMEGFMNLF